MLSISDHRRDFAGFRYVYPVVSRRAGGVSVGINLNVNNACNWRCAYCQVEGLTRGAPPPVDHALLVSELSALLQAILHEGYLDRHAPPEARRLVDVAFSGNGEPTSASTFDVCVAQVVAVLAGFDLVGTLPLRLITNGSLMHRPVVLAGLDALAAAGGEVWFKLDRVGEQTLAVNGVRLNADRVRKQLDACLSRAPTWVQTCWFQIDAAPPSVGELGAYCDFLRGFSGRLRGVHLYGLARPSLQPGAERLSRIAPTDMASIAELIQQKTGLTVQVSP